MKVLGDKLRGLVRLFFSGVFFALALYKITSQPLGEMLYTSRVATIIYLSISLFLAVSAVILLKKKESRVGRNE